MKSLVRHISVFIVLLLMMPFVGSAQFYPASRAADPTLFLHAPISDDSNPYWGDDIYRHFQSKSLRDSANVSDMKLATFDYRSTNASSLQYYYANNHVKFFQSAFGLQLSTSVNKDLFLFLDSCRLCSNHLVNNIPSTWTRLRPCVRLREANFGMLRNSSSYAYNYASSPSNSFPSCEATYGWLTGMVMSCLNPWHADTILARTYQHGLFRVVSGASWSSDINLCRQLGCVTFAQLMSMPHFRQSLLVARQKTSTRLNIEQSASTIDQLLSNDTLTHKLSSLIPDLFVESDGGFQSDLQRYLTLTPYRDSLPSGDLLGSTFMDPDNAIDAFQPVISMAIDPISAPYTYDLLHSVQSCCEIMCQQAKSRAPTRRRPFEVFHTPPLTLEDPEALCLESSYPSSHASKGLAIALTLSMIAPECRDTLLQAGYQYGLNRVICGTNWYSDVEAGRLLGCMAVALVASGSDFIELLELAQDEYQSMQDVIITDNPSIHSDAASREIPLFTIDGRRATSTSRGILVGLGKKIIKP